MISVIIPTYNKATLLNLTLASFVRQTSKYFELVIVDDGSNDNTEHIVQSYRNKLNLVYIRQMNSGRSQARNAGILSSSGIYLLFNDDDRIVKNDFIAEHEKALTEHSHGIIVGGKGRVLTVWRKNQLPLRKNDTKILSKSLGDQWRKISKSKYAELITADDLELNFDSTVKRICLGDEFDADHLLTIHTDQVADFRLSWMLGTTANLSVRKDAVVEVGMFDPAFRGWGMEDSELCYRLQVHGLKLKEHLQAYNYHQIHPIGRLWFHPTLSQSRIRDLRKNVDYFHEKTKSPCSFVFRKAFYGKIPILIANEILIEFENALQEKTIPYSEWGNLFSAIMKRRKKEAGKSKWL